MLRLNLAALETMVKIPEPERRRVTLAVEIDVEGTLTDAEAEKLIRETLIIDCWVGAVVREEIIQTMVIDAD